MQGAPLPLSAQGFPARLPTGLRPPGRIFICDNDLDFAEELASGLATSGFEVITLAGAASPNEVFASFQPNVLLLDIFMPPPDGFEVLDQLRGDPRHQDMSLVLISGAGTNLLDVAARFCVARKMRLAATLEKPLKLADIIRICAIHAGSA
jgi:DNA-binding response OmpR family regulator